MESLVELLVEELAQGQLLVELLLRDVAQAPHVLQARLGVAHREGRILRFEEARPGMFVASVDRDEGRQGLVGPLCQSRHPRPGRGVYDRGSLGVSGPHEVAARSVRPLGGGHGTNQRDLVGLSGQLREVMAELDAIRCCLDGLGRAPVFRRRLGLGVEGVKVGHAARHEEVNDTFGLAASPGHGAGIGRKGGRGEEVPGGTRDGDAQAGLCGGSHKGAAGEFVELVQFGHGIGLESGGWRRPRRHRLDWIR